MVNMVKRIIIPVFCLFFGILLISCEVNSPINVNNNDLMLWYDQPASIWEEALPLGNGSLGAMVTGGIQSERIYLNESSVWAGQYHFNDNKEMPDKIHEIRQALFEGDYAKADELTKKYCTTVNDPRYGSYQPLGDLYLSFNHTRDSITGYKRTLDIDNAVALVEYKTGDALFLREMFISAIDKVMVIKLSCSKKKSISLNIELKRDKGATSGTLGNDRLVLDGICEFGGSAFYAEVKVIPSGGDLQVKDGKLIVSNADETIILLSANTDYWGHDPVAKSSELINAASERKYKKIINDHIKDYQHFFRRVSLHLGSTGNNKDLPTDQRIMKMQEKDDPALTALLFHYGRYLLISSSRPGGLPANLQGIWNKDFKPAWFCDFTINVNFQMNYWPAEVCNLSELTQPMFEQIERMYPAGKKSAKERYGYNGWELSTRSTPWGINELRGSSDLLFQESAAWLCTHLWEHYRYTGNKEFLKKYYPLIRDAALFYYEYLVEHPKSGYLVAGPTNSPENKFFGKDGKRYSVSMGTTMSTQIVNDILSICNQSAIILGIDEDFRKQVMEKKSKLLPMRIGSKGQLLEWIEEYPEVEPQHRHVSHLYGLYPANQINFKTPELMSAAKKTLEMRGDGGTGWSKAWKVCFWARLQDGNHANKLIHEFFKMNSKTRTNYTSGGIYPNMLCAHPPFQIDGNFGITAGIAEMLMQSQGEDIHILPALPDSWGVGEVKGLVARGRFVINISWQDGKIVKLQLTSPNGGICNIRYGDKETSLDTEKHKQYTFNESLQLI
jgi:alpha-L-fucosidase 2